MTEPNLLELDSALVTLRNESPQVCEYNVRSVELPPACPGCGSFAIKKHGVEGPTLIPDTPRNGKLTALWLTRWRVLCLEPECRKATTVRPQWMHPNFRATNRLVEAVQRDALNLTFSHVARTYGVDEKTVRSMFSELAVRLQAERPVLVPPRVLGIDETWLYKKPRLVLTNIEKGTLLEMYPERNYSVLGEILAGFRREGGVKVVTMDMHRPYRTVVRRHLPHAAIVVDKFHLLRLADSGVDEYRRVVQKDKKLEEKVRRKIKRSRYLLKARRPKMNVFQWGHMAELRKLRPDLHTIWDARERFYAVYNAQTREEAERLHAAWEASLDASLRTVFKDLRRAVKNWREEVFAYFDHRYTNATTESLNNLIQLISKNGRGYTFEMIRLKALYGERHQRRTTLKRLVARDDDDRVDRLSRLPDFDFEQVPATYGSSLGGVMRELKATFKPDHEHPA